MLDSARKPLLGPKRCATYSARHAPCTAGMQRIRELAPSASLPVLERAEGQYSA